MYDITLWSVQAGEVLALRLQCEHARHLVVEFWSIEGGPQNGTVFVERLNFVKY